MEIENLLAAASFEPLSVQFPDSWVGHTPFAFWLIKEIQPKVFVELGVHSGNSYFAFCQAIKEGRFQTKSYAIDRWTGDEHSGVYDDKVFEYVNDHNQNHYSAFSTLMRMDFDEAAREFSSNSIDLLHIDGFHSYEAVRHDFETWLPKLSSQGIVIFHDINVHLPDFGVYKFWEELKLRYSNTIEFMHSNGLGVLFLLEGPEKNLILPFLKQSKMEHKLFISYFSQLGERTLLIDADLRPEGKNGPLVRSLSSFASYYERWSSGWEVQALLRAEFAAGNSGLGQKFSELINPIRYNTAGLPDAQLREIRRLKARMESERLPRGVDPTLHTKLGPGGLSDVEWVVQVFQLQKGFDVPALQTTRTLKALAAATDEGLIDVGDSEVLAEAWTLVTRVRNASALVKGRAVDVLPTDVNDISRVAYALGFGLRGGQQLTDEYRRTTRRARSVVMRVFYGE